MTTRRGRPPKFGRPGRLVAVTLPEDVVEWLEARGGDLGWAIVALVEGSRPRQRPGAEARPADAELVAVGDGRQLIVVAQALFDRLPGVSMVGMGGGRAFLALEPGQGLADLELAVLDRLEAPGVPAAERRALTAFRRQLRAWRQDRTVAFSTRSIVVAERTRRRPRAR